MNVPGYVDHERKPGKPADELHGKDSPQILGQRAKRFSSLVEDGWPSLVVTHAPSWLPFLNDCASNCNRAS